MLCRKNFPRTRSVRTWYSSSTYLPFVVLVWRRLFRLFPYLTLVCTMCSPSLIMVVDNFILSRFRYFSKYSCQPYWTNSASRVMLSLHVLGRGYVITFIIAHDFFGKGSGSKIYV